MELSATYGSHQTPCTLFVHEGWYAVEGSSNVNHTYEEIEDGVDIEGLADDDCFTWPDGIDTLEELIEAVEA